MVAETSRVGGMLLTVREYERKRVDQQVGVGEVLRTPNQHRPRPSSRSELRDDAVRRPVSSSSFAVVRNSGEPLGVGSPRSRLVSKIRQEAGTSPIDLSSSSHWVDTRIVFTLPACAFVRLACRRARQRQGVRSVRVEFLALDLSDRRGSGSTTPASASAAWRRGPAALLGTWVRGDDT